MMRQPVEQDGGHFGIAEHARPFAEGELGGDNDRGLRIKPADQMGTATGRRPGRRANSRVRRAPENPAASQSRPAALAGQPWLRPPAG